MAASIPSHIIGAMVSASRFRQRRDRYGAEVVCEQARSRGWRRSSRPCSARRDGRPMVDPIRRLGLQDQVLIRVTNTRMPALRRS
jgi:hypothetical protein